MSQTSESASPGSSFLCWPALLLSVVGIAGSVYLSVGMDLAACPLCFYQRTFVMSVFAVLMFGLIFGPSSTRLGLLALPMSVSGLAVAGFHVFLEQSGILECPRGILEVGSAPQQSLALFVLLTLVLLGDVVLSKQPIVAVLLAVVVGCGLAYLCRWSSPPLPPKPKEPYSAPLKICRPPYVSPGE